jgi:hypothetical protein
LPSILSHSSSPSAYPFDRTTVYSPSNIYAAWDDAQYDDIFFSAVKEAQRRITEAALEEGQNIEKAPKYPNYAIYDTPVEEVYGEHLERLQKVKRRIDPLDVMGLSGGFKIRPFE